MNNKIKQKPELRKKLNVWAWILSVVVMIAVVAMRQISIDVGSDLAFLPPFHSSVNLLAGIALIFAFVFVKQGRIEWHKRAILVAMFLSLIFLLSYVLYHITQDPVRYEGTGILRTIYFVLLITHIIAAAIIFPFVLFTFVRGYTNFVEEHKSMARWVFPIWLYVCISGPVTYLMLKPYF